MSDYTTVFGSLRNFEKGRIEIINDKPRNYCFSNVLEAAMGLYASSEAEEVADA